MVEGGAASSRPAAEPRTVRQLTGRMDNAVRHPRAGLLQDTVGHQGLLQALMALSPNRIIKHFKRGLAGRPQQKADHVNCVHTRGEGRG